MADFANNSDDFADELPERLGGHLLLAHPGIGDPHFFRSVVLLTAHTPEDGAVGIVINRPMDAVLGEHVPDFAFGPLAQVRLYEGGPVQPDQLLLVGWRWVARQCAFELHFGISEEKAAELLREHPEFELRGFFGYAGWSAGQLEDELEAGGWAVLPLSDTRLADAPPETLWHSYALEAMPEWALAAEAPEDPSVN